MTLVLLILVILAATACIVAEIWFRKRSVKKFGKVYEPVGKAKLSDYIAKYRSYPYLPYLMNKAPLGDKEVPATHRFAPEGSKTRSFAINENGLFDILNPENVQPPDSREIVLLIGSSALEGIVYENNNFFSVGSLLQGKLDECQPGKFRVVTMAMAGWLSSEILIYAQLKYLRLKPKYVVYYHGANDVLAACSPNFQSDYSHYRKNIAEVFTYIKKKLILSSFFPYLPGFTFYEFLLRKAGLRFHPVYELSKLLRPNQPVPALADGLEDKLQIEAENIGYLFSACKAIDAKLLCIPYQYWVYDENSIWQKIQKKGVTIENNNLLFLSEKYSGIYLSEINSAIRHSPEYFLDEQHFNLYGMKVLTDLIAISITKGNG